MLDGVEWKCISRIKLTSSSRRIAARTIFLMSARSFQQASKTNICRGSATLTLSFHKFRFLFLTKALILLSRYPCFGAHGQQHAMYVLLGTKMGPFADEDNRPRKGKREENIYIYIYIIKEQERETEKKL